MFSFTRQIEKNMAGSRFSISHLNKHLNEIRENLAKFFACASKSLALTLQMSRGTILDRLVSNWVTLDCIGPSRVQAHTSAKLRHEKAVFAIRATRKIGL